MGSETTETTEAAAVRCRGIRGATTAGATRYASGQRHCCRACSVVCRANAACHRPASRAVPGRATVTMRVPTPSGGAGSSAHQSPCRGTRLNGWSSPRSALWPMIRTGCGRWPRRFPGTSLSSSRGRVGPQPRHRCPRSRERGSSQVKGILMGALKADTGSLSQIAHCTADGPVRRSCDPILGLRK